MYYVLNCFHASVKTVNEPTAVNLVDTFTLKNRCFIRPFLWNNCQRPGIFYAKRSADVFNVYFSWFINERCTRCRLYEFLSAVRKLVNKLHVRYIRCIFFYHGSRQSNWTGICDTGILLRFNWPAPPSVQPSCTKDPPIHAPRCFFTKPAWCLSYVSLLNDLNYRQ